LFVLLYQYNLYAAASNIVFALLQMNSVISWEMLSSASCATTLPDESYIGGIDKHAKEHERYGTLTAKINESGVCFVKRERGGSLAQPKEVACTQKEIAIVAII
jgi:hypothetical protein